MRVPFGLLQPLTEENEILPMGLGRAIGAVELSTKFPAVEPEHRCDLSVPAPEIQATRCGRGQDRTIVHLSLLAQRPQADPNASGRMSQLST